MFALFVYRFCFYFLVYYFFFLNLNELFTLFSTL